MSRADTATEQGPCQARVSGCSYPKRPAKGKEKKKKKAQGFEREGPRERNSQISGASSEPSGQSFSPSHRQPFEIQVIWSLQANCFGLQVLGAEGKGRKGRVRGRTAVNSWTLELPMPPQHQILHRAQL